MRTCVLAAACVVLLAGVSPAGEPEVTGIAVFHRHGQTFVTWKDVAEGEAGAEYRYSVYRADKPITQENLDKAEVVIQGILSNSCKLQGMDLTAKYRLDPKKPRVKLTEGGEPLAMWTGVGVHTVAADGKGYYAVVATDLALKPLSRVAAGESATTEPVEEKVAPFQPIKQVSAETRHKEIGKISGKKGLPLYVQLHASCSSKAWMAYRGDYFTYFAPKEFGWRAGQPGVFGLSERKDESGRAYLCLVPRDTMNKPDGKRGVENLWFGLWCKPNWSTETEPRAYPFSEKRVEWIIDWVLKNYGADPNRICIGGQSMGAWGTFSIGLKRPRTFAALYPTGPKCRHGTLYRARGRKHYRGRKPPMMPDGKTSFFDYLDLVAFVERTHGDLPFACFIGGRHGGYAPWKDMVPMVKALTKNHHGFGFGWDNRGHGSARTQFKLLRKYYPVEKFALNKSYPAFGNSSIDDDMGPDGPKEGYVNVGFVWKSVVDEKDKWSATISNAEAKVDMTVDVTPRRCQDFKPKPGESFKWTAAGESGNVTADEWGLVTVEKVKIKQGQETTLTLSR